MAHTLRVGHYVHHQGSGHLHRGLVLAAALERRGAAVTMLSSAPRPAGYAGEWVDLPRDDEPPVGQDADVTAAGHLHWVPPGHPGLRERMAALSAWISRAAPDVLVSDVSQEVTLLARLHGVPVVSVVLPGDRTDPAHLLGLGVSSELVGFWPPEAAAMTPGLPGDLAARLRPLGALSRFAPRSTPSSPPWPDQARTCPLVVVLAGSGGDGVDADDLRRAERKTPGWRWRVLAPGSWVGDPWPLLCAADVVVTHAGQNALAEVAAARTPALVVPAQRPHDEQATTAGVLGSGRWPALVRRAWPAEGWADLLDEVAGLDGDRWSSWVDGRAADRFADLLTLRRGAGAAS